MKVNVYVSKVQNPTLEEPNEFAILDLFQDESIEITKKITDIEKLSNVFTDFTKSFTVPATNTNNDIFKHYYDADVIGGINANIKIDAYIEVDSFIFSNGQIQLESVQLQKHQPYSYKITFYGELAQLTTTFGDTTLQELSYTDLDYTFNDTNFMSYLKDPDSSEVIYPLIAYTNRNWNIGAGSSGSSDISTSGGAVEWQELIPAIRIENIIDAIENQFNISFTTIPDKNNLSATTRGFFDSSTFKNLYLWMNDSSNRKNVTIVPLNGTLTSSPDPDEPLSDRNMSISNNKLTITRTIPAGQIVYEFDCKIIPATGFEDIEYTLSLINTDGVIKSQTVTGEFTLNQVDIFDSVYWFQIECNSIFNYTSDIRITTSLPGVGDFRYWAITNPEVSNRSKIFIIDFIPKMKVIDFIQGLMKMFKLLIYPIERKNNITTFYIDTIDNFYASGNYIDISAYVDYTELNIERPVLYKSIVMNYLKSDNFQEVAIREDIDPVNKQYGLGDLFLQPQLGISTPTEGNDLKVEIPFECMYLSNLSNKPVIVGKSIKESNGEYTPNDSKPIMFFCNGLNLFNTGIYVKGPSGSISHIKQTKFISNVNNSDYNQYTNSLFFGLYYANNFSDVDTGQRFEISRNLYSQNWYTWISDAYAEKQRKYTLKAFLPTRYATELSLNDILIIQNTRYKINEYSLNFVTGETKFVLTRDIYTHSYLDNITGDYVILLDSRMYDSIEEKNILYYSPGLTYFDILVATNDPQNIDIQLIDVGDGNDWIEILTKKIPTRTYTFKLKGNNTTGGGQRTMKIRFTSGSAFEDVYVNQLDLL